MKRRMQWPNEEDCGKTEGRENLTVSGLGVNKLRKVLKKNEPEGGRKNKTVTEFRRRLI